MALSVQRGRSGLVDVGGDDAIEVAPTDDESEGYASFVDAFGIIRTPRNRIRNGWVYA